MKRTKTWMWIFPALCAVGGVLSYDKLPVLGVILLISALLLSVLIPFFRRVRRVYSDATLMFDGLLLYLFLAALCYDNEFITKFGVNLESFLAVGVVCYVLSDISAWYRSYRNRITDNAQPKQKYPLAILQLVCTLCLMLATAVSALSLNGGVWMIALVAYTICMSVCLTVLIFNQNRFTLKLRKELRIGICSDCILFVFPYINMLTSADGSFGEIPILFHVLYLSIFVVDIIRWIFERDTRLDVFDYKRALEKLKS